MKNEFNLPKEAFVNKTISKSLIYSNAELNRNKQKKFTENIKKIRWLYKIAENTVNINKTEKVIEIQIFEVELRKKSFPKKELDILDKKIPYHILYKFICNDNVAYGIALKDIYDEDVRIKNYYYSEWNENINFEFNGINLEKVYEKLVEKFIKYKVSDNFEENIEINEKIKLLENEIAKLESKIHKEKQFNKRVEINKILLDKKSLLQKYYTQIKE